VRPEWAIVYFGQLFKNLKSSPKWATVYRIYSINYAIFLQEMGWAKFWAIFSQTHLVALLPIKTFFRVQLRFKAR
jgi:hypothetical protein